jgi:hypothetical protein
MILAQLVPGEQGDEGGEGEKRQEYLHGLQNHA